MEGPLTRASDTASAVPTEASSVPAVVAPPPRHPRFPLIDGLRALAALAIVGVHASVAGQALSSSPGGRLLAHLNIGVALFFPISGFLLYRPFIAHRAGGAESPSVPEYAKRRVLRIYPAYWLVLTVLVVVPGVTGVIDGHWLPMYALVHTLPIYHGRGCIDVPFQCGLGQTWSLVVEVTFYAVLPLWVLVVGRLTSGLSRRRWIAAELLALAAVATASVLLHFVLIDPTRWMTGSVAGYGLWFALGMGMAVVSVATRGADRQPRLLALITARPAICWALALAGYVGVALWLPASPFLFLRRDQLVEHLAFGAIAALLLAPAVFARPQGGLPRRVLAQPVVAWLGMISYGIFLWHYAVVLRLGPYGAKASFAVVLIATLAISIACAAASYYLVERPLLRLKYRSIGDLLAWRRTRT